MLTPHARLRVTLNGARSAELIMYLLSMKIDNWQPWPWNRFHSLINTDFIIKFVVYNVEECVITYFFKDSAS